MTRLVGVYLVVVLLSLALLYPAEGKGRGKGKGKGPCKCRSKCGEDEVETTGACKAKGGKHRVNCCKAPYCDCKKKCRTYEVGESDVCAGGDMYCCYGYEAYN